VDGWIVAPHLCYSVYNSTVYCFLFSLEDIPVRGLLGVSNISLALCGKEMAVSSALAGVNSGLSKGHIVYRGSINKRKYANGNKLMYERMEEEMKASEYNAI